MIAGVSSVLPSQLINTATNTTAGNSAASRNNAQRLGVPSLTEQASGSLTGSSTGLTLDQALANSNGDVTDAIAIAVHLIGIPGMRTVVVCIWDPVAVKIIDLTIRVIQVLSTEFFHGKPEFYFPDSRLSP